MKVLILTAAILFLNTISVLAKPCVDSAKVVMPVMSSETKADYEKKLDDARIIAVTSPNGGDADSIIWYGRRTAYTGRYKDAIGIFSTAIARWPEDARMYRHRGHRYITLRCFDDAIKDLETAAKLIHGKPDEVEPDGLPNAKNIPTGTLQSNIWYHLGLAYYLRGDWNKAAANFMSSYNRAYIAKSPDMMVASAYWVYLSAARYGKSQRESADRFLKDEIRDDLDIIENHDYYKLVKLNKGLLKAEDLLKEIQADANTLSSASLGYGIGNYFLYNGDKEGAMNIFRKVVAGNQWASFGYIAAESELKKPE